MPLPAPWRDRLPHLAPFAGLAGWVVVGTAGYAWLEGFPFYDALYMTVITISTVGFQEVHPLDATGRAFTLFLIVGGLSTALYAFTRLGQMVVEGEILDLYGRRRRMREIERLTDHYVICGFGRAARPVADGLQREGVPFCVVERDPALEATLREARIPHVLGDATEEETLQRAGIERARGVVALLASDADNLYLTMSAKGLNPKARILVRASDEKAETKLRRAGADEIVMPYRMAGLHVIQAITRPHVLHFLRVVSQPQYQLDMEEVPVAAGSALAGVSLGDAQLRSRTGAIIVAIQREGSPMLFNPTSAERIEAGDTLLALGPADDLRKLAALVKAKG